MIQDDRKNRGNQQFITNIRGQSPPLVTTNFQVIDQGKISYFTIHLNLKQKNCAQIKSLVSGQSPKLNDDAFNKNHTKVCEIVQMGNISGKFVVTPSGFS